MRAAEIIEILLWENQRQSAKGVVEASVHRPRRGQRWIASFRDEAGSQRWKSTGLTNKSAALVLAKEWEAAARRKRGIAYKTPKKALIRVRSGIGKGDTGLFTQKEVAMLLKISERAVRQIERRAVEKLRHHPTLRRLWREWQTGEIKEDSNSESRGQLTQSELAAVYGLARTPAERELLRRLFAYAATDHSR